jgi:hypothetical protein
LGVSVRLGVSVGATVGVSVGFFEIDGAVEGASKLVGSGVTDGAIDKDGLRVDGWCKRNGGGE